MRIFGLTGGIASGKSTVGKLFQKLGAPLVDADLLAREVVAPGSEGLAEIVAEFGEDVLDDEGKLNRKKLGELVFSDQGARQKLNQITHPRIAAAGQRAMAEFRAKGEPVALYEAALIVENNLHKTLDGLIVVSIPRELQIERLQKRDNIDRSAAEARIQSQLDLSEKLKVATHVIDNAGDEQSTAEQVAKIWNELCLG
jgi:dephospho-CoA kinase